MRIIICGKAASGKDFMKEKFIGRGFKAEVSYTTRPMRDGEEDGKTYHYITDEEFDKMIKNDKFLQWKSFVSWRYGTHKFEWSTKNLFIQTPEGIESLSSEDRSKAFVIYINIPEDIRERRLRERKDSDDVERRLNADREQFDNFTDYDMMIDSPHF